MATTSISVTTLRDPLIRTADNSVLKFTEKVMFTTSNLLNITQTDTTQTNTTQTNATNLNTTQTDTTNLNTTQTNTNKLDMTQFKYQQYDTDGKIRHSFKIQEQYSCVIDSVAYDNLVKLLKSPIAHRKNEAYINSGLTGYGKIFNRYIKNVKFGDRLNYALSEKKIGPNKYYTYRAESDENLTKTEWPFTVYEIGINYGTGKKYPCVNFVIKVHGTSSVPLEFSSYESCRKTFKEKSFEFNIHIYPTKENIEDKKTFADVVETLLTNARARDFNCTSNDNIGVYLNSTDVNQTKQVGVKTYTNNWYTIPQAIVAEKKE